MIPVRYLPETEEAGDELVRAMREDLDVHPLAEAIENYEAIAAAFDPAKHPHEPAGSSKGGEWAAKVGVTPFRPEDNPEGFYESDKYRQFERQLGPTAARYQVTIDGQERVSGFWQGDHEPSLALDVHDGEDGVRRFAEDLRGSWDQDAVLLFHPDPNGEAFAYRVEGVSGDPSGALTEAGIDGATIHRGAVTVVGSADDSGKVAELVRILKIDPKNVAVDAGNLEFVERP